MFAVIRENLGKQSETNTDRPCPSFSTHINIGRYIDIRRNYLDIQDKLERAKEKSIKMLDNIHYKVITEITPIIIVR